MARYVLRRLLALVPVLIGVSVILFLCLRIVPGDAAIIKAGAFASNQEVDVVRTELGLNDPLPVQYFDWMWGVVRLDWGTSFWTGRGVLTELTDRLPVTVELAILALLVSIVVGVPLGVVSAVRQNSPMDYAARILSILGLAVPGFWLATMFILISSKYFNWLPPFEYKEFTEDPWENMQQMFLPALALGLSTSAIVARFTRSSLLEVLRQDYIRTAAAKGLRERFIIVRHGLKNALIPVLTLVGNQAGFLVGGSVIMESIFNLPGVGRLILEAISRRDYPLVQGNVLVLATGFVLINLVVDVLYVWLDPRIRYA